MTENEAKEKECCGPEGCGTFKYDGTSSPMRMPVMDEFGRHKRYCMGSACMAWRFIEFNQRIALGMITIRQEEHGDTLPDALTWLASVRNGYCGLAAKE